MRPVILLALSLSLAHSAFAEIYREVGADGKVRYTDQPPPDQPAEKVELPSINTTPPVRTQPATTADDDDDKPRGYDSVTLISPADDTVLTPGEEGVNVVLSLEPGLLSGHRIQWLVNGEAQGKPSRRATLSWTAPHRGSFTFQAKIQNADGKTVATSDTRSVHVKRPSVLLPPNKSSAN